MAQYINKSAVVAEIEKRLNVQNKDRDFNYLQIKELESLLSFLDTIETEEVDLKKEIYDAEKRFGDIDEMGGYRILIFDDEFRDILRHFFELGLKTNKGE